MLRQTLSSGLAILVCSLAGAAQPPLSPKYDAAIQAADSLLKSYHELSEAESPDEAAILAAEQKALQALTAAMKLEFELRAQRINSARRRLDEVEKKLSESRAAIGKLVQERMTLRLAELSETDTQGFETPREVLERMEQTVSNGDFEGFAELLTEDAVRDLAGGILLSTATVSIVRQMVQSTGTSDADPQLNQMKGVEQLLERSMHPNPPPKAIAAYTETMKYYANTLFQPSPNLIGPPDVQRVRTAVDVLKDPRTFVVQAMQIMHAMDGSVKLMQRADGGNVQWSISENGNVAIATSDEPAQNGLPQATMELKRIDGGWKISKLISDEALLAIATGPQIMRDDSQIRSAASLPMTGAPVPDSTMMEGPPQQTPPIPPPRAVGTPYRVGTPSYGNASPATPSWATPVQPANVAPSSPQPSHYYSGKTIVSWLDQYWESGDTEFTQQALKAIKRLREQDDSDFWILDRLRLWYHSVDRELNQERLARVANAIIEVAGARHQEIAVEYLFQIASRAVGTIESIEQFQQNNVDLFNMGLSIQAWDETLAKQVAKYLADGSTSQRVVALAFFFHLPIDAKHSTTHEARLGKWINDHRALFADGILAATRDESSVVRLLALLSAPPVIQEPAVLSQRLIEAVKSDPALDVRHSALDSLLSLEPTNQFAHQTVVRWAHSESANDVDFALSLFENGIYDARRSLFVDDMIQLLQEPSWGLNQVTRNQFESNKYQWPRAQVIGILGKYEERAEQAIEALQREMERSNEKTRAVSKFAMGEIKGFHESLPVASLQGDWVIDSVNSTGNEQPPVLMSDKTDSDGQHVVTINETEIVVDGTLVARISGVTGDDKTRVRLTTAPGSDRVDYSGQWEMDSTGQSVRLKLVQDRKPYHNSVTLKDDRTKHEWMLRRPAEAKSPRAKSPRAKSP